MRLRATVVATLLALLLAGCSGSSGAPTPVAAPTSSPTSSPAASPASPTAVPSASASPAASCVPAFPATTLPDTGSPVGGQLGMKSASAGPHTGYDRVVFTLGGNAAAKPGWRVEYVAAPTSDGSGNPVSVHGPSYLRAIIKEVGYPGDTGVPDPAVKRFSPSGTTVVREVVLDTVFEGQYTAFIGVRSTLPFRVFRLGNPARVVVDVRHC